MESPAARSLEGQGRRLSLETIRPWRKRTLQIISTEKWRKESEVTPLPQVHTNMIYSIKNEANDLMLFQYSPFN